MFYVYENWTNTFTKVHRAECSYCNNGRGFHGAEPRTPSGEWHGPYPSAAEALRAAQRYASCHDNRAAWTVDTCRACSAS